MRLLSAPLAVMLVRTFASHPTRTIAPWSCGMTDALIFAPHENPEALVAKVTALEKSSDRLNLCKIRTACASAA